MSTLFTLAVVVATAGYIYYIANISAEPDGVDFKGYFKWVKSFFVKNDDTSP